MAGPLDIQAIARAAAARGYFSLDLLKGRQWRPEELRALYDEVSRQHIPLESPPDPAENLDVRDGVQIINALRHGTVPQCDLSALSVGRHMLRKRLTDDLQEVGRGSPRVRFLDAAYGAGKTHSLWLLAEAAFRQNFAVSFVTLSPGTCPLNSMLAVYGAIVNGIHTAGSRNQRGLRRLLDRWIEILQHDGQAVAQNRIRELAPYFVTALAEYAGARVNPIRPNHSRQDLLLEYLSGKRTLLRDLRALGIDHHITEANALTTLKEVTLLVRQLSFRGLCIFFDEAESVLSLNRAPQVDQAYQNLLRIVRAGPDLRNCYFVYAATPGFFDEYAAYWGESEAINPTHIYPLDRLSDDEMMELAKRISIIYGKAYDHAVPLQKIETIGQLLSSRTSDVGSFVRNVVTVLDRERRGG